MDDRIATMWRLLLPAALLLLLSCFMLRESLFSSRGKQQQKQEREESERRRGPALTQLWPIKETDENHMIDIVAIHGIDTQSPRTWEMFKNGRDTKDGVVNWLKDEDMLHHEFPQARIFTYDWFSGSFHDVAHDSLHGHAVTLLNRLSQRHNPSRHLILIASSFGGLLLAKAVTLAAQRHTEYERLYQSMTNMIFLGTPFRKTPAADSASMRVQGAKLMGYDVNSQLIEYLKTNDNSLNEIVHFFGQTTKGQGYKIICYYETARSHIMKSVFPSFIAKWFPWGNMVLVNKDSASLDAFESRPLNVPHGLMNKFHGPADENYIDVCESLRELEKKVKAGDIRTKLEEYYTHNDSQRLKIQRISGDYLPMKDCYINLSIIRHGHDTEQTAQDSSRSSTRGDQSSFSLAARLKVEMPATDKQVTLQTLFYVRKTKHGVEQRPKRVLIWGRAGVGKTTLSKKIAHDFVHNQLWNDLFDYLFWIPLRELKRDHWRSHTLESFLEKFFGFRTGDHEHHLQAQLQMILRNQMHRILFILDGLDEVSYSFDTDDMIDHPLWHLIRSENIIITSRPHANRLLPDNIDLELETIGFSPKQVDKYLQNLVERKELKHATIQEIYSFIQPRPLVENLIRIPIMLDAICYSWSSDIVSCHNKDTFVNMAGFYKRIEDKLWVGYVGRREKNQTRNNLWNRVGKEDIDKESKCLQQLAFSGMYNEVVEFDDKYIKEADIPAHIYNDHLLNMPFLRSSDNLSGDLKENRHFLHLTFQEYFAAQYFVHHWIEEMNMKLPKDPSTRPSTGGAISPVAFLRSEKYSSRYNIFWRFVAGLLQLQSDEDAERFLSLLNREPCDLLGPAHQRLLIQCLNEVDTTAKPRDMHNRIVNRYREWILSEYSIQKSTSLASIEECPDSIYIYLLRSTPKTLTVGLSALKMRQVLSSPCIDELMRLLADKDSHVRSSAVNALGGQKQLLESVVNKLVALLEDEDSRVRWSAVNALGGQKQLLESAVNKLVALLKDGDSHVRSKAADALEGRSHISRAAISNLISDSYAAASDTHDLRRFLRGRRELCSFLRDSSQSLIQNLLTLWLRDSFGGWETYVVINEDGSILFNLNGILHIEEGFSEQQLDTIRQAQYEMHKQFGLPSRSTEE